MINKEQIETLVENHVAGSAIFLVEVVVRSGNRIAVFLDGDQGVTIEDCKTVNKYLNGQLDRDTEDYDLTVSSAGADRPLKLPRQYRKNTGRKLEITTNSGEILTGTVISAEETGVQLEVSPARKSKKETETISVYLEFTNIKSAREVIEF